MPELDRTRNSLSQPRSIFPRKFSFRLLYSPSLQSQYLIALALALYFAGEDWPGRQGTFLPVAFMSILVLIPATWCNLSNHGYNIVKAWELHFLSTITLQHNTDANLECPEHKIPSLFCRLRDIWSSLKQQTKIHNFENIQRTFESLHPLQSREGEIRYRRGSMQHRFKP